ncbi:MAG: SDR family oxidoreductase [Kofleriaceae bacterium]|nr:MAG: SDR family oxidoreductase [Kofleriaceae bacterium]MBZ0234827.1 SDR family oxidoreductase [Kofleriaceae bacterium]
MSHRDAPTPASQRIFQPGLFDGQVALVTGGGSGIGLATAVELARLGAKVAICGRTAEKLEAARAEIAAVAPAGAEAVHTATCDIREDEQVKATVAGVVERWGAIDVLVNNAGGQFPSPAQHISANGFTAVVKNNLLGTWNVTREVANQSMIPKQRGRVIMVIANIYRGFPGMAHTGAARAGVENLTMSLAVEWSQFGILVNAVAPGIIISTGTMRYPPEIVARGIRATPLKRAGTVDEVAASILFLASPAAQYITGATLRIDGAQALWGDTWELPA